ncbi:MAG: DUF3833 family protein [Alphaproteobacteria bacterium]|nr:DUF3833 family protein [Alphaproteobacteria bacterium]
MSRASAVVLLPVLFVSSCALAPGLPKDTGPTPFVIERDLEGPTVARGEFSAINGLKRGFTAYLDGARSGDIFTLTERFEYDDGEKDQKTWVLTLKGDGAYTGTREDVVGKAKGWQDGQAFRLAYDVRLPNEKGEPGLKVHFQDVMVKTAEGVVLNNASVGKWGFGIARVELEIKRLE